MSKEPTDDIHATSALLCSMLIEGKDNSVSCINVFDALNFSGEPEQMPESPPLMTRGLVAVKASQP
ncbi:MAG TPA: hypothetical protein VN345_04790, partial [Blastocatellia bacterium]|nr:hypothetical protein [Blastocatellia bacterium]